MMWMIIVVIAYIPIFYKIHYRIGQLEDEIAQLKEEMD